MSDVSEGRKSRDEGSSAASGLCCKHGYPVEGDELARACYENKTVATLCDQRPPYPSQEDYDLLDAWLVKAKRRGEKGWASLMHKRELEALERVLEKI